MPHAKTERNQKIKALRVQGGTFEEIGTAFGISKQRVQQIAPEPRRYRFIGDRTQRIYDFLLAYMTDHCGLPPTRQEIGTHLQISTSVVHYHMQKLADQGWIAWHKTANARSYYLPGAQWTPPSN